MKILGVIPARYKSTRLPGKPLADICGKPMIWWVYQQVQQVINFNEVYVATDDLRIQKVCDSYNIKTVMTRDNHPDHISRIHEVSEKVEADYYICVNGDEPLIDPNSIQKIIPDKIKSEAYFCGAMRLLTDPAQTIDFANIKIVTDNMNHALYMSRTPVPYPKASLEFSYNKYVGIECFNKKALDFFVENPYGKLEKIEDIDHLRFLENGMTLNFKYVESESLSVDTPKDLDYVRNLMRKRIEGEES